MQNQNKSFRLTEEENKSLTRLADARNMSVSEYIKTKLFIHNSDFLEDDTKYICPSDAKHNYFIAFSQIRLLHVMRELFIREKIMTIEEFKKFYAETKAQDEEILFSLGYKKVGAKKDE
jgi:hypothetical protein